jgi:hypothetical protein
VKEVNPPNEAESVVAVQEICRPDPNPNPNILQDADQTISNSNPIRKVHQLDPTKVDENNLFSLSHHLHN